MVDIDRKFEFHNALCSTLSKRKYSNKRGKINMNIKYTASNITHNLPSNVDELDCILLCRNEEIERAGEKSVY